MEERRLVTIGYIGCQLHCIMVTRSHPQHNGERCQCESGYHGYSDHLPIVVTILYIAISCTQHTTHTNIHTRTHTHAHTHTHTYLSVACHTMWLPSLSQ